MTALHPASAAPSDAELISRVRGGDVEAYGPLFDRHREAAYRIARQLSRGPDADDLVSEAFAKVLAVLKKGGGPDLAFRAYLLTAIRRLHTDRMRSASRVHPTDDFEAWDAGVPFQDPAVEEFERSAAARAFASLPERWQVVLWHLEVEGQKPAEVGVLLGMSANSVSALAYRAREGLRQAYLSMHLADTAGEACRWTTEHLSGYVRSALSRRDTARVEEHLQECPRCTAVYAELVEVNDNLRGLVAPVVLGAAAAAYLKGSATTATGGALAPVFGKVGSFLSAPANALAAGGVAATAAAVVAVAATTMGGGSPAGSAAVADGGPSTLVAVPTGDGRDSDRPRRVPAAGAGGPAGVDGGRGAMGGAGDAPDGGVVAAPTTTASATDGAAPTGPGAAASTSPTGPATTAGSTPTEPDEPTSTGPELPTPSAPEPPDPSITAPTVTLPTVTLPTVTLPTITSPTITPPTVTLPTITLPTINPPVPLGVDLGVRLSTTPLTPVGAVVVVNVSAPEVPEGGVVLTVDVSPASEIQLPGTPWSCEGVESAQLACSVAGQPPALPVTVITAEEATVTATVSAPDNEDPNTANNTASVTIN